MKFHLFTALRPVCCPRIRGRKISTRKFEPCAKQGTVGENETSVFTLRDSFSMEAIQVYKLKVTLLSLLSNLQSHMRYISKGVAMAMCDLISSVAKDSFFYLQLEIGGVLG
jgi:hypothetical protein